MPDILEQLQEESLRLAIGSFDSVDCGIAANVADAAIREIERLRALIPTPAQTVSMREALEAALPHLETLHSLIPMGEARRFVFSVVKQCRAALASQPPAAPVERTWDKLNKEQSR